MAKETKKGIIKFRVGDKVIPSRADNGSIRYSTKGVVEVAEKFDPDSIKWQFLVRWEDDTAYWYDSEDLILVTPEHIRDWKKKLDDF